MLVAVKESRGLRGRVYGLVFMLAASLVAVLAGASNFRQITDHIDDFPSSLMRKLGARWCYFRHAFRRPSEKTVRLVLSGIDAGQFDTLAGAWLRERAKPETDGMMTVAIDGKVLRGAWTDENEKFTLFSAMIHGIGVTIARSRSQRTRTRSPRSRHFWTRKQTLRQQGTQPGGGLDAATAAAEFTTWLRARHTDRRELPKDLDELATELADSWCINNIDAVFTTCSPHWVALFVQHVHNFYLDDFADQLVTLLPDWIRWLAARNATPIELAERCLPYAEGQPHPQLITDNNIEPAYLARVAE